MQEDLGDVGERSGPFGESKQQVVVLGPVGADAEPADVDHHGSTGDHEVRDVVVVPEPFE